MKKIIASAVGIVMIGGVAVTNASAVENIFGGYWRTRIFSLTDFDGVNSSYNRVDNRTRLYYTAKFSDDFKFVNKLEWNSNWGDDNGGDFGADGTGHIRVKNSYADFNMGSTRTKVGIMGGAFGRGFLFDTDFSGLVITPTFGNVSVPLWWARATGEYVSTDGFDEDVLVAQVKVGLGDSGSVTPYFVYHGANGTASALETFYLGIDADLKFGDASTWGTFIYQGGTNVMDQDNKGFLIGLGGSMSMFNAELLYATGDNSPGDGDNDQFAGVAGARSYYWSEIMGYGTFDSAVSNGSPGDNISNLFAIKVGVKVKPSDVWTIKADLWYAQLAEDNLAGDNELGTELDFKATYKMMDNLNLDLVAAYLFAGDATGTEDPVEVGARLSLSF